MADMTGKKQKAAATCPVCSKTASHEFRPFCSRGCKDRDLLKWLGDGYRIEGPPASPDALGHGADEQ